MLGRVARLLAPGLLLCLIGLYRVASPPARGVESHLTALPSVLMGLSGVDVPVQQAILDDLGSDELLIRRYTRPDDVPVWVVVIYFVNTRLGGHDPQLCYRSQGFRTEDLPDAKIESTVGALKTENFSATRPGRRERVATFWYAPGGRIVPDVRSYRRMLFFQGLRQNRTYGAFVRVSTLETDQPGLAEEWNARFAAVVAGYLPQLIREQSDSR